MSEGSRSGSDPCSAKALELLALRSHFRRELARKLERRGFGDEEIERTLEWLAAMGHVDERRTARELVESRLRRRPEGRRRLLAELGRRGVAAEVAAQVVDELLPEEEQLAFAAAQRWARRGGDSPAALARHLERRGFTARAIVGALRHAEGDEPVDD